MNLEKLTDAPASLLKDVTAIPEGVKPTETGNTNQAPTTESAPLKGSVSEQSILDSTKHTKISTILPSDTPATPGAASLPGNGNSVALGAMIEGKLAIELMDALLPGLFVAALYAIDIKLRKSELQLTEKEKTVIAPIMQNCLNTILLNFDSPWQTLGVTLAVIYGSKVSEKGLVAWIDKLNEKKEREALEEKISSEPTPLNKTQVKADRQASKTGAEINKDQHTTTVLKPGYGNAELARIKKEKKLNTEKAIAFLNKKYSLPTDYKPAA